jgi:hypothetical protein
MAPDLSVFYVANRALANAIASSDARTIFAKSESGLNLYNFCCCELRATALFTLQNWLPIAALRDHIPHVCITIPQE